MMAKGVIRLKDNKLNKQLKQAMQRAPEETVKALFECTVDLAANSAKRAPVDTGDLRNNCTAKVNGTTVYEKRSVLGKAVAPNTKVVATVGYSGLPYIIRQHEDLTLHHPALAKRKHMTGEDIAEAEKKGGEAKFLERPFKERKKGYINRIKEVPGRSVK